MGMKRASQAEEWAASGTLKIDKGENRLVIAVTLPSFQYLDGEAAMATYVMLGKYTLEGLRGISAKRTDEARALLKRHGGELKALYALLGEVDILAIVELPDTARAMQFAVALTRLLGVRFTTTPAVTIEEFDQLMG